MPDITIAGATFRNVPQIDVPKDGGGSASFIYEEGTKQINTNGTHDVSGYLNAQVSVPSQSPVTESLSVTENGTYTPPSGVDGYSPVTVNVSGGDEPVPTDGKTRIWIHIADDTPDNRLTFYLRFQASAANNTSVDWGDGTVEALGSTSTTNYPHKYASGGNYTITMTVNTGIIKFDGDSNNAIYGSRGGDNYINRSRIKRIIIGNSVSEITSNVFNGCYGLSEVDFLSSTSLSSYSEYVFQYCYIMQKITLPSTLRYIPKYGFAACFSLFKLTIPSRVNTIGEYAFSNCYGMAEYHLEPTTPPALANSNAFTNIASDCIIYVPYSADHSILNAYKTAANWSAYSAKMQEEPQ